MAKKCPTYAGSQNGGFANPHKPKIRFCEPYFRGLGIRRYAGSQIFPCILHGDGCGTPMYFVWRRLARVPKIPMYFAWSGWRHKVWKRPSPGKSGQDSQALRGRPTSTLCAGTRRQSPACAGRRHPARGRRSAAAELDVGAVLSQGDGSRGWVGDVCGERGVSTPRGTSRSRE